ncbi:MAG: peptidoglycan synthetase [Bacteroidetes bacterium]|nr:MAG: peptidoglycan synthetase [Bacteroidota bacterium]
MNVHFIAIGGSAMHNLAIALHKKGYRISGSDDQIFEPSKSRLAKYGLLPSETGWKPDKINQEIDAVILGMHAKEDNPELQMARELKLKIYSYPEYLYEQSKDKNRIVIGGSHGKTTITSMILHVLQYHKIDIDYMVGAQLEGFDVMVKLTDDAPHIILEGDEYLSSVLDKRPKFHLYKPHIALISGIAWDHINVFPTFENYLQQFRIFINQIEKYGKLIYCAEDKTLKKLSEESPRKDICRFPYRIPDYVIKEGVSYLKYYGNEFPLQVFGEHNLLNISGAMQVCKQLGVSEDMFLQAIAGFKGASNRLQFLAANNHSIVFKDFAHAPSKLKATTEAVKKQFPDKKLIACMELHTYSSLNKDFLQEYAGSMNLADEAMVFYNPGALKLKRLPDLNPQMIYDAFGKKNLKIFSDALQMRMEILAQKQKNAAFLFMTSANFGNIDLNELAIELTR